MDRLPVLSEMPPENPSEYSPETSAGSGLNFENRLAALRKQVGHAPTGPGCYLWKNERGEVLYVGKAVNLRSRLRNYVSNSFDHSRTYWLMRLARSFETILTDTEKEALILEANLVKKIQPRFNVRLKDDKRYPYICVSLSEPFPQIFITRTIRDDGNAYFGPYTDVRATRNMIALIHKIFPIRKVRQKLPLKKPGRPCMNFHIKRCLGPCQGTVPEAEYRKIVDEIVLFLEGKREILENIVITRMQEYSAAEEYETAAIYRDMLMNIRSATESQNVVQNGPAGATIENQDILALARRDDHGQIALLEIRGGRMLGRKSFPLQGLSGALAGKKKKAQPAGSGPPESPNPNLEANLDPNTEAPDLAAEDSEVIEAFLRDYYLGASQLPSQIVVPVNFKGRKLFEAALSERAERKIRVGPSRAPQIKSLSRLATRNAELLLSERLLATRMRDREKALADLETMLNLNAPPAVMECYDISHFQGAQTVASGIMFVDGAPHKAGYRHYRIRSLEKAGDINDPASIREAVARRIQRLLNEDRSLPDLILIDGGATQLHAACEAAAALGAEDLPIVGLAKEREEIYLPGESIPRSFDPNRSGMRLLRQMRDEAHRFAITHHRSSRNKQTLRHILDGVPDIGPARKQALLKHFAGDQPIAEASVEDLSSVAGIGPELAKKIRAYLDEQAAVPAPSGRE
ncbi:MAG: excinuclease ABC subunit UvrC [bacterium]|nr:excinuclease ABC subunit UvrC [bacterium]